MTEDEYIEQRLEDQMNWYDKKSRAAQRTFKWIRGSEIVIAATIPVLAIFSNASDERAWVPIAMGVLGAVVVVLASFLSLGHYQENWTQYRTTCESLKHEKFRFLTKSDPYGGEDAFSTFVERVENLISKENSEWLQVVRTEQKAPAPSHA